MFIVRTIAALLIGFLIGWGGLGGHGAHMAMAGQPAVPHMMAGHADGHAHTAHGHGGHGGMQDGQGAKPATPACCLFACSLVTVLPSPDLRFSDADWEVLRLAVAGDTLMAGRSVSPLRRPPRPAA